MVRGRYRGPGLRVPVMDVILAGAAVWAVGEVPAEAAEEVSAREVITLHGEPGNIPV